MRLSSCAGRHSCTASALTRMNVFESREQGQMSHWGCGNRFAIEDIEDIKAELTDML